MRRPLANPADIARDKSFWLAATALVVAQLLAFWMVCSEQVRRAETRNAALHAEHLAMTDCLRSIPNATVISCAARLAPLDREAQAMAAIEASGAAVPVNEVYR